MIQTLQSLRFVFIMLIVLSHIIGKSFDFGGECGVSFFFMLSGFVLSLAYGNQVTEGRFRTRKFMLRQLLKFYPLHLLMLVAFVVLDARLGNYYDWQHLVPNILLLQSWIPYEEYFFVANGPSWFLCDILFFYSVFSLAYRLLNRLGVTHLLVLGAVVAVLYGLLAFSIPLWKVNSILYVSPATRLIDFCLGILLCRLYRSKTGLAWGERIKESNTAVATLCELCLVVLLILSFFAYESMTWRLRCAVPFWLVIPPILLFFAMSDKHGGYITRLLRHSVLLWCASVSLEIYLVHMLVLRVVDNLMAIVGIAQGVLTATMGLIVMFPVAWLTKRFFVDKIYVSLIKYVE
jgi:peptidoglycan/LPS O-acetylase OafA/YrhL